MTASMAEHDPPIDSQPHRSVLEDTRELIRERIARAAALMGLWWWRHDVHA